MTTPSSRAGAGAGASEERLLVRHYSEVAEREARGALRARQVFHESTAGFESSLSFVLWNRIPAGGANELHVHEDIEKVYYFLKGEGEVACGPWTKPVREGDFLFFPAAIPHMVRNLGSDDLQFIVCAAHTLGTPRGLGEAEREAAP